MPTVKLPDGSTASFPDGMSPQDIQGAIEQHISTQSAPPQKGFLSSALDSSGLSSLGHAIAHPIDTVAGLPAAVAGMYHNARTEGSAAVDAAKQGSYGAALSHAIQAVPIAGQTAQAVSNAIPAGADNSYSGILKREITSPAAMGTITGAAAAPLIAEAPGAVAGRVLPAIGNAAVSAGEAGQEAGIGVMNKTVGALQADFKRGANPSRGYFNAGGGPALSMSGLSEKALRLKAATGSAMGDIRDEATAAGYTVPSDAVLNAIQRPIARAKSILSGPGGPGGENPTAIMDNYEQGFAPIVQKLNSGQSLTPNEVFDLKQQIGENTTWGDASQVGLKKVRQQQSGALGGTLNENLPYGEHAQNYADLSKFANRAQLRQATGSQPLTHLAAEAGGAAIGAAAGGPVGAVGGILANSIPVKSTLASGLFYGGKALNSLGTRLLPDAAPIQAPLYSTPALLPPLALPLPRRTGTQ